MSKISEKIIITSTPKGSGMCYWMHNYEEYLLREKISKRKSKLKRVLYGKN